MAEEFEQFLTEFSTTLKKVRAATAYLYDDAIEDDLDEDGQEQTGTFIDNLAQYFSVGLIVEEFLKHCNKGNILEDRVIQDFRDPHDHENIKKRDEPCDLSFEHYSFRDTIEDGMRHMIVMLRDDLLDEEENPIFSDEELNILSMGRRLFLYSYRGAIYNQMKPYETAAAFEGLCNLEKIQDDVHEYDQQQSVLDSEYFVFEKYFEKNQFSKNSYLITIAPRAALRWVKEKYQEPEDTQPALSFPMFLN